MWPNIGARMAEGKARLINTPLFTAHYVDIFDTARNDDQSLPWCTKSDNPVTEAREVL